MRVGPLWWSQWPYKNRKRDRERTLPPPHGPSTGSNKVASWSHEESFHPKPNLMAPWLWTSSLHNCEKKKCLLFKRPIPWYFVTAALTDWYTPMQVSSQFPKWANRCTEVDWPGSRSWCWGQSWNQICLTPKPSLCPLHYLAKSGGSGASVPGFEVQLCHFLAL